jgi:hypothetical protein
LRVSHALPDLKDALIAADSSGLTVGMYRLMKMWIDARNGRRLRISVGDVEVEATQMAEKDVLRLLELVQERADKAKITKLLLDSTATCEKP